MDNPFAQLIGMKLSIARRAGNMRAFHFGKIRQLENGTAGEFALHISCPWRLDGPDSTITGSRDLWDHISGEPMPDDWEPNERDNIQDVRLGHLLKGYDIPTRSHVNITDHLTVEHSTLSKYGDITIALSDGYSLTVFPAGSNGEQCRLFRPASDEAHIVFENGSVELDG